MNCSPVIVAYALLRAASALVPTPAPNLAYHRGDLLLGAGILACLLRMAQAFLPVFGAVIIVLLTRIAVIILPLLLCCCDRLPESYPPPEQRQPQTLTPDPYAMIVEMNDPDAAQHIVKDIYEPMGSSWRWTAKRPTVKVLVDAADNLKLSVDFAIWDDGFKQTGPLELSYFVNGRLLDKVKYATPGYKHFEKAVPAEWLSADAESTISVDVDKLYVAPQDGVKFGFILTRIGFLR